jgi:hypothetical protein
MKLFGFSQLFGTSERVRLAAEDVVSVMSLCAFFQGPKTLQRK